MQSCFDDKTARELVSARRASILRSALEGHVEECPACRQLVANIARLEPARAPSERRVAIPEPPSYGDAELAPGSRAGPYRVEQAISSGSAGTVYRAVDERTGAVVALKYVTDTALRSRFERESETLARLNHPAIVRYLAHGKTAGGMYLAMEWLEGADLAQVLHRGRLDWQSARVLGLRLTGALDHAHALGCVHRDLSPRNVFLPGGRLEDAKLLDFGLVRVDDRHKTNTTPQSMLGTAFYMAPEQVKNSRNVDARSDLFGLGVLLFETLAGSRPFQGDDVFTIWLRIVDQPTPDLRALAPSVPEPFVRLIEGLLAKDRDRRPASADEVRRALAVL